MISVVIATFNQAPALSRTLAALVPAAVDGLVREVILADGGSTDETLAVADDVGARVETGGMVQAIALARSDWLLLLAPGGPLPAGWCEAAQAHIQTVPPAPAWWGERRWLGRAAASTLLVPRALCDAAGGYSGPFAKRIARTARRLKL
jgi:glycosyltransferase involved in cell wall biosynthesis